MKILPICFFVFFIQTFMFSNPFSEDTNRVDAQNNKQGLWQEEGEGGMWTGKYIYNKKEGPWLSYHPNKMISELYTYSGGAINGIHLVFDRNGFLLTEEYFVNNLLDGVAKEFYAGGKLKSETPYANGMLNGTRILYSATGIFLEKANFKEGKKDGITQWFNGEGKVYLEQTYKNGVIEGPMKSYYKTNGNIEEEGTFLNNELDGQYFRYFENGKVQESGKYVKGKREGTWKEFDENGKVKTVKYNNGERK